MNGERMAVQVGVTPMHRQVYTRTRQDTESFILIGALGIASLIAMFFAQAFLDGGASWTTGEAAPGWLSAFLDRWLGWTPGLPNNLWVTVPSSSSITGGWAFWAYR